MSAPGVRLREWAKQIRENRTFGLTLMAERLDQEATLADEEVERAWREVDRLTGWLQKIDGGDRPCTDESQLRQWAYEAIVLRRQP